MTTSTIGWLRRGAAALFGTLLIAAGPAAFAQPARSYPVRGPEPRIQGFDLEQVRRITPGTELDFTLWGTPGGSAMLRIDGAQRGLTLQEVQPGVYEGHYTIGMNDRIDARSGVRANLRLGDQVASAVLAETIVADGRPAPRPVMEAGPRIDRFEVQPSPNLERGEELAFKLFGTPGGQVSVAIDGARGQFFLPEVRPGEYSGEYTIRGNDRITPNSPVNATLRIGERSTNSSLNRPLLAAGPPPRPAPDRRPRACADCGVVESIRPIEVSGQGGFLGTVAGGVIGGVAGNQVGKGDGRTAATVAGVIGGALAGRAIENHQRKATHYEVLVRLQNGGTQTVAFETEPNVQVGNRVRVVDGTLVLDDRP